LKISKSSFSPCDARNEVTSFEPTPIIRELNRRPPGTRGSLIGRNIRHCGVFY